MAGNAENLGKMVGDRAAWLYSRNAIGISEPFRGCADAPECGGSVASHAHCRRGTLDRCSLSTSRLPESFPEFRCRNHWQNSCSDGGTVFTNSNRRGALDCLFWILFTLSFCAVAGSHCYFCVRIDAVAEDRACFAGCDRGFL